jgi:hypothetical protein
MHHKSVKACSTDSLGWQDSIVSKALPSWAGQAPHLHQVSYTDAAIVYGHEIYYAI